MTFSELASVWILTSAFASPGFAMCAKHLKKSDRESIQKYGAHEHVFDTEKWHPSRTFVVDHEILALSHRLSTRELYFTPAADVLKGRPAEPTLGLFYLVHPSFLNQIEIAQSKLWDDDPRAPEAFFAKIDINSRETRGGRINGFRGSAGVNPRHAIENLVFDLYYLGFPQQDLLVKGAKLGAFGSVSAALRPFGDSAATLRNVRGHAAYVGMSPMHENWVVKLRTVRRGSRIAFIFEPPGHSGARVNCIDCELDVETFLRR